MLDRQKGKLVFECNGPGCSEVLETNKGVFNDARDVFVEEGWTSRKSKRSDEWLHFCPRCSR